MSRLIFRIFLAMALVVVCFYGFRTYKQRQSQFLCNQAIALASRGEYKQAIKNYTDAINEDPQNSWAFRKRAQAFDHEGDEKKAQEDFLKAYQLNPKDHKSLLDVAISYELLNNYSKSLEYYQKVAALDPNWDLLHENWGTLYDHLLKDYSKARDEYSKAIAISPRNVRVITNRCDSNNYLRHFQEALKDCNSAIKIDPNYERAYFERGKAYEGLKRLSDAEKEFSKAISLDPHDKLAYENRAYMEYSFTDYREAIKDYEKTMAIDPGYTRPLLMLANSYYMLEDCDKVKTIVDDLLRKDSKNTGGLYILGSCYYKEGKDSQSLEALNKIIDIDPAFSIAFVVRADVYNKERNFQLALKDINRAIELNPGQIESFITRGYIYLSLHEYQKAEDDYRKATEHGLNYQGWVDIVDQLVKNNGTGLVNINFPNGSKGETYYKDGKPDGIQRYFYANGKLYSEGNVKGQEPYGPLKYFDKEGNVRMEESFVDGKLEGTSKEYYKNGKVELELNFRGNKLNGISKFYLEDGKLAQEDEYVDGQLNGKVTRYYPSGKVQYSMQFKDNVLLDSTNQPFTGLFRTYYESGKPELEINLDNGKPKGNAKEYYEDGRLKFEGSYNFDESKKELIKATAKAFNPQGGLQFELSAEDSVKFMMKEYDAKGKVKESIDQDYIKAMRYNNQAYDFYLKGSQLELGLDLIEKALANQPKNFAFLDTKAVLLYKVGQIDKAYEIIQKVSKLAPKDPDVKQHFLMIKAAVDAHKQ